LSGFMRQQSSLALRVNNERNKLENSCRIRIYDCVSLLNYRIGFTKQSISTLK
jgi:hypothetical protein